MVSAAGLWRGSTNFLFRFGEGKRLAAAGMAMFHSGLVLLLALETSARGFGLDSSLRGRDPCIHPFRPRGMPASALCRHRTDPDLFGGIRCCLASGHLRPVAGILVGARLPPRSTGRTAMVPRFTGFAALCFILVLPAPLLLKACGFRSPVPEGSPALLRGHDFSFPGEARSHGRALDRSRYLDRLAEFQAAFPGDVHHFTSEQEAFLLAIDWSTLEPVVLPAGPNHATIEMLHGKL